MDNPFKLLDLPVAYAIHPDELEKRFVSASSRHHPDRFLDPIEQADAADRMSAITQAYQTLKDPERRANALIKHFGGPAKEDDKTLPPDLLMEVMEVREELETAVEKSDAEELSRLREWARSRRAEHEKKIGELLDDQPDPDALKSARLELNALRYMNRMLDQIPAT